MRIVCRWIPFLLLLSPAIAGELRKETLSAWDEYLQCANDSMADRLRPGHRFLWIDEHPQFIQQVRDGNLVVSPVGEPSPKHIPYGLIHHWIGVIFLAHARLNDVLSVIRDYDHYRNFYPAVLASKVLRRDGADDQFSLLMISRAALARTAFASQDQATYYEPDPRRWYSKSYTTRVQEVADYGEPEEHTLPPDQGHGYVWRLYSLIRYEQRDGGVYLEMEAIALSRDIPVAVRWFIDPVVRRLSRESMSQTLRRTEEAVGAVMAAGACNCTIGNPSR